MRPYVRLAMLFKLRVWCKARQYIFLSLLFKHDSIFSVLLVGSALSSTCWGPAFCMCQSIFGEYALLSLADA